MSIYTINNKGVAELRAILAEWAIHWQGCEPEDIPDGVVSAYADDAEGNMTENGDGRFEIGRFKCVGGNPLTFSLMDDGFDQHENEHDHAASVLCHR